MNKSKRAPRKVACALIGAGWWGVYAHIPALKSHPQAWLVCVQSRERAKAERIGRDFGISRACTDVEELLATPGLDAVVISSTPNVHYEQARLALERGIHVLLEKPMTFTAAQARELVELAAKRNLVLAISCPWHFTPHSIEARRLILCGQLGEVKLVSILMTNPVDKLLRGIDTSPTHRGREAYVEPRPGSYSDPAVAGGGQIYCQVSHAAAHLSFLTGQRAADVFARFQRLDTVNDIYDALTITLERGAIVSLASTGATPECERNYEVRVFGTKAILQLELWRGTMQLIGFDGSRREFPPLRPEQVYPSQAPALNFIDALLGRAENGSPGELGLAAMEIIEAACDSARTGRSESIRPVSESAPAFNAARALPGKGARIRPGENPSQFVH